MRLTRGDGSATPNLRDQLFGMTVLILPNVVVFVVPVLVAAMMASRPFRLYLTAAARFRWKMLFNSMLVAELGSNAAFRFASAFGAGSSHAVDRSFCERSLADWRKLVQDHALDR